MTCLSLTAVCGLVSFNIVDQGEEFPFLLVEKPLHCLVLSKHCGPFPTSGLGTSFLQAVTGGSWKRAV